MVVSKWQPDIKGSDPADIGHPGVFGGSESDSRAK